MGNGQFDRTAHWLELVGAARRALGLQLWLEFVAPSEHQPPGRIGLEDLATVGDATVGEHQSPGRSSPPIALLVHAEPILLHDFGIGERRPKFLWRRADER